MAKMLKNLKSLFIVEEQNAPEKPAEDPKPTVTPSPKIAESREGDPGKITQKFIEVLFKAMESNNLDGFDYLEFKQSLQSLSKMPMDEATRFRSAFAMAETMGATTQQLLSSANHYIDVLKSEETKFEKALANQREQQIGRKQVEIQEMEEAIQKKAEEIKRLTTEIEAHRKKVDALKGEMNAAAGKVESTKNDFIASYNKLVDQIHADVESIKKQLLSGSEPKK